jgi:hypothetical protein
MVDYAAIRSWPWSSRSAAALFLLSGHGGEGARRCSAVVVSLLFQLALEARGELERDDTLFYAFWASAVCGVAIFFLLVSI